MSSNETIKLEANHKPQGWCVHQLGYLAALLAPFARCMQATFCCHSSQTRAWRQKLDKQKTMEV
jgi:hypothetical protein